MTTGSFSYLTGKPFGFGFIGGQGSNGTPAGALGVVGKNDEGETVGVYRVYRAGTIC